MLFVNGKLKYIKINNKNRCCIKLKIKYKLATSILLAILLSNVLTITLADAQKPAINHEEVKYIRGLCEFTDYSYDIYVSKITNYQKENTHYSVFLYIYDKTTGVTIIYDSSDVNEFYMNMNHGYTVFEMDGKPFRVEWTAIGNTQVTMEKYEIPYQGDSILYATQIEYLKTQGTCTVFYDNDVASGTVESAGHRITQLDRKSVV